MGYNSKRGFVPLEDFEQSMVCQWAELSKARVPELDLLYAIPNGSYKSWAAASKFKRTGLKSGVPDLHLPVARGKHHSLYIEMKREIGGVLSTNQKKWIHALQEQGHRVEVCAGNEEAKAAILAYLS